MKIFVLTVKTFVYRLASIQKTEKEMLRIRLCKYAALCSVGATSQEIPPPWSRSEEANTGRLWCLVGRSWCAAVRVGSDWPYPYYHWAAVTSEGHKRVRLRNLARPWLCNGLGRVWQWQSVERTAIERNSNPKLTAACGTIHTSCKAGVAISQQPNHFVQSGLLRKYCGHYPRPEPCRASSIQYGKLASEDHTLMLFKHSIVRLARDQKTACLETLHLIKAPSFRDNVHLA